MKTKLFFYSLCFAMMSFIMASCSSSTDELVPNASDKEELVQVPIGFSGEILDIEESPLNRANTAKDWYLFQVYAKATNDTYGYYNKYAYGIFDNKSDMIINLKKGYEYKFEVQMIVDGSQKVSYFELFSGPSNIITNSFLVSNEDGMRFMHSGRLYIKSKDGYELANRPNADRFFGCIEGYSPEKGKSITINMKRVAFGVKFVPKKFNEGELEIKVEGALSLNLKSTDTQELEDIISYNDLFGAYSATEEYAEDIPVNIIWIKSDNTRVPIASQSVTFKRNKLTTITFEVKEQTEKNSIDLKSDETMQNGDTVEVGGDGTNHNVDPQP